MYRIYVRANIGPVKKSPISRGGELEQLHEKRQDRFALALKTLAALSFLNLQ